ncbi:MAG: SET domain-containing protein [Planctomycetota bacterium]
MNGIVEVRDSAIHGKGLFAARPIRKGEIIGKVVGSLTSTDGPYVLWISDELGLEVHNDLRYINHAAKPNAAYYDDGEVIAVRPIAPGEEITHDYGDDAFNDEPDDSAEADTAGSFPPLGISQPA